MNAQLNKNEPVCDLSSFDLTSDELAIVLDRITKELSNIGYIRWHSNTIKNHSAIVQTIESELISHNEQFTTHPSDYIHCKFCCFPLSLIP